jgi:hypothetical protein
VHVYGIPRKSGTTKLELSELKLFSRKNNSLHPSPLASLHSFVEHTNNTHITAYLPWMHSGKLRRSRGMSGESFCHMAKLILMQCRTVAAATFILSALLYTGLLPFHFFVWDSRFVFKLPPQLWRLVTPFLITGPQLSIIFDTYFSKHYVPPRYSRIGQLISDKSI